MRRAGWGPPPLKQSEAQPLRRRTTPKANSPPANSGSPAGSGTCALRSIVKACPQLPPVGSDSASVERPPTTPCVVIPKKDNHTLESPFTLMAGHCILLPPTYAMPWKTPRACFAGCSLGRGGSPVTERARCAAHCQFTWGSGARMPDESPTQSRQKSDRGFLSKTRA